MTMAFTIEMTVRGVLEAGKWRTAEELNHMSTEDKRNTLITVLSGLTNETGDHYQQYPTDVLVGKGAVLAFLREAKIRDDSALKTMRDDDPRNTLIVVANGYTDRPISELQGLTNQALVQSALEWYAKSKTVAAILEFYWNIDNAKVVQSVPDIIEQQTFDNREASLPLKRKFIVKKEVTNTSTFSHEHGFDVSVGAALKVKAGVPELATTEKSVKIDVSTSHTWSFGEENSTKQSYELESDVEVPPHKGLMKIASVTKGNLDVPYRAKIRAADGSKQWIEGTWNGVSTVNLIEKQVDIKD